MGSSLSRAVHGYMARNERRLLLVGIDGAGKSTILQYVRRRNGKGTAVPLTQGSIDFDVESLKHDKLLFHLWDVRGQDQMRPYWRHYYTGTQGVIFVIDAADRARLDVAASELRSLATDEQLADAAILVLANKADVAGALTAADISRRLDLPLMLAGHPWHVQAASGTTGTGVEEGLAFLAANMRPL